MPDSTPFLKTIPGTMTSILAPALAGGLLTGALVQNTPERHGETPEERTQRILRNAGMGALLGGGLGGGWLMMNQNMPEPAPLNSGVSGSNALEKVLNGTGNVVSHGVDLVKSQPVAVATATLGGTLAGHFSRKLPWLGTARHPVGRLSRVGSGAGWGTLIGAALQYLAKDRP